MDPMGYAKWRGDRQPQWNEDADKASTWIGSHAASQDQLKQRDSALPPEAATWEIEPPLQ